MKTQEVQFELTHNGEVIFTGSENDCYMKLQRSQSQSADWAIKYEGWKVEPAKALNLKTSLKDFGTSLTKLKQENKAGNRIEQNHFGDFLMLKEDNGDTKYKVWLSHPDSVKEGQAAWQIEYFGKENGYTWTIISEGK